MKLKFRADAKDVFIFIVFSIFLLYFVAIAVVNLGTFAQEGTFAGLNPLPAFSKDYLLATIIGYIGALVAIIMSVSSLFFEREKGFGFSTDPKKEKGYSMAWLHHKGVNKHHYEHWQDNFDNGGMPLCMPYKETVEMLCDYLGAGRAYNGKNFSFQKEYNWWQNKSSKPLKMHQVQKDFFNDIFYEMLITNKIPSKELVKDLYDKHCKMNNI